LTNAHWLALAVEQSGHCGYAIALLTAVTVAEVGRDDRTDIIYSEIVKIVKVPRGIGFWGDMVLTLRDGNRLELRAVA